MAYDFKKEYKEFYMPGAKPTIVEVPSANYIAVRGKGDPNKEDGDYKKAIGLLYAVAFTLKMSYKTDKRIEGFYEYVVPPLEGFWWQEKNGVILPGFDYKDKSSFNWISLIRLPDFVRQEDFDWTKEIVSAKKGPDSSRSELLVIEEGDCVQIMHKGSYDAEPASIKLMDDFAESNGWKLDFSATRLHHEIYLSDPRKTSAENLKTVIRHPVKKIEQNRTTPCTL